MNSKLVDSIDSSPSISKKRNNESSIWSSFLKREEKIHCIHCDVEYSLTTGTSSLKKHLKIHNNSIEQLVSQTALSTAKQNELEDKLMNFIVSDLQPFNLLESQAFQDFVHCLCPQFRLPVRQTLISKLDKVYSDLRTENERFLHSSHGDFSIIYDIWSAKNMNPYIAVTAHFIDKEWVLRSAVLYVCLFRGQHTANSIADKVEEIISCYGNSNIKNRIKAITCDNGANVLAAVRIL